MRPDDTFVPVPTIDAPLLEHTLRRRVFNLLLRRAKITPAVVDAMQSWHHSGFSAHTRVRVTPEEPQAAERVLRYLLRPPVTNARTRPHERPRWGGGTDVARFIRVRLLFDRGTVLAADPPGGLDLAEVAGFRWDARVQAYRAPASSYPIIKTRLSPGTVKLRVLPGRAGGTPLLV